MVVLGRFHPFQDRRQPPTHSSGAYGDLRGEGAFGNHSVDCRAGASGFPGDIPHSEESVLVLVHANRSFIGLPAAPNLLERPLDDKAL